MTLHPSARAPAGAPILRFSARKAPATAIALPDHMTLDATPAPLAKWQSEGRARAYRDIKRLRAKRTLYVRTELAELERNEDWLREQLEHDRDAALFDLWCTRVAAVMPEFTTTEAQMIARYAPVMPFEIGARPWHDSLADILATLANQPGIAARYAFSDDGRAALLRAATTARTLSAQRIMEMELLIRGIRIGCEPRAARRRMRP